MLKKCFTNLRFFKFCDNKALLKDFKIILIYSKLNYIFAL